MLMMFTVHTRRCPDYLTDSVQACNSDPGRTRLHSASSTNYSVPRTRTKLGDRAFSVAGPVVWNSLPTAVREADSLYSFKRKLKTHLFTLCFTD